MFVLRDETVRAVRDNHPGIALERALSGIL